MAETVLITTQDLEPAVRLRDGFEAAGYAVELVTPGERLSDVEEPVLLVLTGALGEKQAVRLAREAAEAGKVPVIALFDSMEDANGGLRQHFGSIEAAVKPVDPAEIVVVGRRLIERRRLREFTGIVGETEAMLEVLERVVQIAPVNATVLITGESGTGKERVARGIHALSPRRHRPFIAANVAALPDTLLESELFGHEKGAFTGAVGQRKGFFELAHRGTLFLDELGEMPLATQAKLLRVLEERSFMRVGGEQEIHVDVRVITATNQHLRQLVDSGRFRRDLYYRLNVLSIHLPPLRERRPDIPVLAETFIRQAAAEHDRPGVVISQEAMAMLVEAPWPGNVRELKNLIESMVVLAPSSVIRPEHIPAEVTRRSNPLLPMPMRFAEPIVRDDGGSLQSMPELEFIFHTLLQLRIDMEELRKQFEEYRRVHESALPSITQVRPFGQPIPPRGFVARGAIEDAELAEPRSEPESDFESERPQIVFRSGMKMAELEAAAIAAALRDVAGNRRKAAEMLGMGERTLYRKIKEYGIPL
jgi:DNA-binding NtrC family response regulator